MQVIDSNINCFRVTLIANTQSFSHSSIFQEIIMIAKLFSALLLTVVASSASATVVDYSMSIARTYQASGQFTGVDGNADGFLSLNELSAFTFDLPAVNYHFGLDIVSDFGRYDIVQNLWHHDAAGWGRTNFAYVSFNGGSSSVNTDNASNVITNVTRAPAQVPEPAPIALFALGLVAIGAARRSKK